VRGEEARVRGEVENRTHHTKHPQPPPQGIACGVERGATARYGHARGGVGDRGTRGGRGTRHPLRQQ
jgi:hypothetical protein